MVIKMDNVISQFTNLDFSSNQRLFGKKLISD